MKKAKKRLPEKLNYDLPNVESLSPKLTPEEVLTWLAQATRLTWEAADKKTRKIYDLQWRGEL